MARTNRYNEARLWTAAVTVTLLTTIWAGLAAKDAFTRLNRDDGGGDGRQAVPSRESAVTHTRTRGS